MTARDRAPAEVKDERLFFRVVRGAFNQRRKTLANALSSALGEYDKTEIESAIAACGLDAKIRGEALDIGGFAALSNSLAGIKNSPRP